MSKRHKIEVFESIGVLPSVSVSLYHDRNKLSRDLRERRIEKDLLVNCHAQTFGADYGKGLVYFVLMEERQNHPLWQQLSLLAHEASHIACRYFESIGESEPAEEERAYVTQAVAGCLFDAHLQWLGKHSSETPR
ncbi:hypothetical protein [Adlercreutzia sp. ZJ242]|uniref:hypothetical protein n=1 Tax=Adlercreutzia sp. ZJ242 TaxID=2709409 RepID=UPI0013EB534F|nr:hypothetical protein [Adlercreutzia sp. ZJ242]